jgi:hypothetical protein
MARHYVVGFVFDDLRETVLLTRSTQAGLLDGIGGQIRSCESAREAIVREFHEEAGVMTDGSLWEHIAQLAHGDQYTVAFFRAVSTDVISRADKAIAIRVRAICSKYVGVVQHLRWLVQFAANPVVRLPLVLTVDDDGLKPFYYKNGGSVETP